MKIGKGYVEKRTLFASVYFVIGSLGSHVGATLAVGPYLRGQQGLSGDRKGRPCATV